jgi:hypothetical protein
MIANAGRNAVKSSNQFWARARSDTRPYRIVTVINKISSGASRLIAYQRSDTRHRKLRRARSRTPAFPLVRAVAMKAGAADPRTFSQCPVRCHSARRNQVIRGYLAQLHHQQGRQLMIKKLSIDDKYAQTPSFPSIALLGTELDPKMALGQTR